MMKIRFPYKAGNLLTRWAVRISTSTVFSCMNVGPHDRRALKWNFKEEDMGIRTELKWLKIS
jgi:hypothetical protein